MYVVGETTVIYKSVRKWYEVKNDKLLDIIMLVTFKNFTGQKEHVIHFIAFYFEEGVTIIYWLANMKLYVLNFVKSYKDTIICYLGDSSTKT